MKRQLDEQEKKFAEKALERLELQLKCDQIDLMETDFALNKGLKHKYKETLNEYEQKGKELENKLENTKLNIGLNIEDKEKADKLKEAADDLQIQIEENQLILNYSIHKNFQRQSDRLEKQRKDLSNQVEATKKNLETLKDQLQNGVEPKQQKKTKITKIKG